MFCKPDTEADNNITLSAYKKQPKKWSPIQQPALEALSLKINKSIKTLKIDGDKELPCLTPQLTPKLVDNAFFHLTATVNLLYQLISIISIQLGRPNPVFFNDSNNFKCITLSNTLRMSNEAAYIVLPLSLK